MDKEELIENIRSSLNSFRKEALGAGLVSSSDITGDKEMNVRSAGHQNSSIFPFNRKKHMKFERLEDENVILSPYYDNTNNLFGSLSMDEMDTLQLFGLDKTIRTDWCSALACDYEEAVVYLDSIEAHGTLWRLVKVKSTNSHSGASKDGAIQSVVLSSSGSGQLLSAAFEQQTRYHLQSCEIGEACMYITRELEVTPRVLDAAEFIFIPLPVPVGDPTSASTGGAGTGRGSTGGAPTSSKNNVEDNNVFGCLCQIKLFNPATRTSSPTKGTKSRGKGEASPEDLFLISDKLSGVALVTMAEFEALERENKEGVLSDSQGSRDDAVGVAGPASAAAVANSLQSTMFWDIFPEDTSTLKADAVPNFFHAASEVELQSIFL
jgi:hypothetical protein